MSDDRESVRFTYGEWGEVTVHFDRAGPVEVIDECARVLYSSVAEAQEGPDAEIIREALARK